MLDVTVVLLDGGLSSAAIMPVEIFHSAGTLLNDLHDQAPQPAFRVRTVSLTGEAVRSPYGLSISPETSLDEIERTDIIIVPTSGLDLDLKLVEKLCGHEVALNAPRPCCCPCRASTSRATRCCRSPSRTTTSASVRSRPSCRPTGRATAPLRTWPTMRAWGLGPSWGASSAATGRLPAAYLQALRIEAAKNMLERDAKPIQSISSEVGYDDVAFFRSLFKRITGMTPTDYRAHFAPLGVRGQPGMATP